MGSIRRLKRPAKFLPKNWFKKYSAEELEQEALICKWNLPSIDGYEGLLAYNNLFFESYKIYKVNVKTTELKKNIPDELTSGILDSSSFNEEVLNFVNKFDIQTRGKVCIAIQGIISEVYEGGGSSIRSISELLGVSKSSIHRLNLILQNQICQERQY